MMRPPGENASAPSPGRGGEAGELRRKQLLFALAGIGAIFVVLLMPVKKAPDHGWAGCWWNLQHLPGFFVLTRCLHALLSAVRPSPRHVYLAAAMGFAAAFGSEWLQGFVGRSASLVDAILDSFGVVLATLWPYREGARPRWPGAGRFVVWLAVLGGGFLFAFAPAIRMELLADDARDRLPVLADLREPESFRPWRPQGPARTRLEPGGSLEVEIRPGLFGGINYFPLVQDWSPYHTLVLEVSNPGPPLRIGIRIDDENSAKDYVWLSDEFLAETGGTSARIGLPREVGRREKWGLDYTRITRLLLFVDKTGETVHFSLRSARLE